VGLEWDKSGPIAKVTAVRALVEGKETLMPADVVVVALGPWSKQLLHWLPEPNTKYERMLAISSIKAHSIVMKPVQPVTAHALFLSYTDETGNFSDPEVYPRPDGDVYMCGVAEPFTVPDDPADVKADEGVKETLHGIVGTLSKQLKDTPVSRVQACCLPCTVDDVPLIGPIPGVNGLYIATGHSCWGILNSPATGEAMAELLVDGKSSTVDLSPFDPKRLYE